MLINVIIIVLASVALFVVWGVAYDKGYNHAISDCKARRRSKRDAV